MPMPANFDDVIFGKTTFGDLLKEIHKKSNETERLIVDLIGQLKEMIANPNDAMLMVPLIAQYMNLSIQTNDQLIKMAAIVQKALDRKTTTDDGGFLTEEEKLQLRDAVKELELSPSSTTQKTLKK